MSGKRPPPTDEELAYVYEVAAAAAELVCEPNQQHWEQLCVKLAAAGMASKARDTETLRALLELAGLE